MPDVEFIGPSGQNQENIQANTCRLVNMFREPAGPGGRTGHILVSVPGMTEWLDLDRLFMADMRQIGDNLFALSGDQMVRISPTRVVTNVGTVVRSEDGHLFGESSQVCAVTGGSYYVYDGSYVTSPTVSNIGNNVGSGAFLNGYTILAEEGGRRFTWSDLLDASTFPGLNVATIEGTEDDNLRVVAINGKLWFFKERSYEIWAPTGLANENAFARIPGAVFNTGLKAKNLVTTLRNAMFYIGSDGIAYLSDGQASKPVSTAAVNTSLRTSEATRCSAYEHEGHKFFVIHFRDRPAWVFDVATAEWHERASGDGAWEVETCVKFNDTWLGGTVKGKIHELSQVYTDNGAPLIRTAVSSTLTRGGDRFRIKRLELYGHMAPKDQGGIPGSDNILALIIDGTPDYIVDGTEVADADDDWDYVTNPDKSPKIDISISGDNGLTWGDWKTRSMGAPGEYDNRVLLLSAGQYRQATMRVRVTDDARLMLNSRMALEIA